MPNGIEWAALRTRVVTLLDALESVGCVVLRRGTIEQYYLDPPAPTAIGKPDVAATEAATFPERNTLDLRNQYDDVLRAIKAAASSEPIDENKFLRSLLAGFLAAAFQQIRTDMPSDELNVLASSVNPAITGVFQLENISAASGMPAIRVKIVSALFPPTTFPFDVRYDENLNSVVANRLSSKAA